VAAHRRLGVVLHVGEIEVVMGERVSVDRDRHLRRLTALDDPDVGGAGDGGDHVLGFVRGLGELVEVFSVDLHGDLAELTGDVLGHVVLDRLGEVVLEPGISWRFRAISVTRSLMVFICGRQASRGLSLTKTSRLLGRLGSVPSSGDRAA